ncbi:MAG: T9SS type A sorting domain-containing protein, partial [Lewinellaceae bacterium]|nr:T9SS type A sorting domain-containing protein [Lewinellaceae bacterium]
MHFEISRSNPQVLYVYQRTSFYGAVLYRSDDGGQQWQLLPFPSGIGSQRAGVMALDPEDENQLWVAFAHQNNDGAKVFRTLDGGQSWENMTTPILDGHRAQAIFYQGGADGAVYLGTDKAVFFRDNSTADWQLFNDGLPMRTQANIFRPFYREGRLRMATYSHGIWEAPFAVPSRPLAQPTVDKLSAGCLRDTFYFDDYSILNHNGATWRWAFSPEPEYVSAPDVRNPRVVFGAEGQYSVTLTVTDGTGQSSSKTIPGMISVQACRVDTIPGMALNLQDAGDYAAIDGLPLHGNELSITAWVRPEGIQPEYTGIVMAADGPAAGFNFRPGMELGYHWPGGAWWWSSGLTVPADEWSYVAMVVRPEGITLYLNGQSATHNFSVEEIDFREISTLIGRYRDWDSRNFSGRIDEVRVYGRALSTDEIRLRRHLTARPEEEPELLAYFQFNEPDGPALNKVAGAHASLAGNAGRTLSTAPVGSGVSSIHVVDQQAAYDFGDTGLSLSFEGAGVLPNGPVVVSRLHIPPDASPGEDALPPSGYWIINNYGANASWGPLNYLNMGGLSVSDAAAAQPDKFSLYHRPDNAEGDTWAPTSHQADHVIAGDGDGAVVFQPDITLPGSGQLIIRQSGLVGTIQLPLPQQFVVYPNPLRSGEPLQVAVSLPSTAYAIALFDANGKLAWQSRGNGASTFEGLSLGAGVYYYQITSPALICTGRLVVVGGPD